MSAQTQFFKAILLIGGAQYPALPGVALSDPKNFLIPQMIGNYGQFNFAEGFQQPTVDVSLIPHDRANDVLSTTFLNLFLTRSNDAAYDTGVISGGIVFWNGRSGFTMNGAKAESFTISVSKGQIINVSARFVGTTLTALGAAPTFTAWDNARPLTFSDTNFAGGLADEVWQAGISFSNHHSPDMSLNGSIGPAAMNAGIPTAGMNFIVQAAKLTGIPDNNPVPVTLVPASMVIAGTVVTRTITLNNPIDNETNNLKVDPPRVMRSHGYTALLATGQGVPVSIS